MAGGLMQLVAYGAQDVYLTGNPQITFFKVVYRRYTNFSMEAIELPIDNVHPGSRFTVQVLRNADLATKTYLRLRLPQITSGMVGGTYDPVNTFNTTSVAWVKRLGHAIVRSVEIQIGGSQIDKHWGVWLDVWYELTHTTMQERGYDAMIGDVPELTTLRPVTNNPSDVLLPTYVLYIPMQFWFCRWYGLALPLIALQYHDVRFNFDLEVMSKLIVWSGLTPPALNNSLSFDDAGLVIDYIYLDSEERRRFAQVGHEYLIEQLQYPADNVPQGTAASTVNPQRFVLNFNHPVKELVFCMRVGAFNGESNVGSFSGSRSQFLTYTNIDLLWPEAVDYANRNLINNMFWPASDMSNIPNQVPVSPVVTGTGTWTVGKTTFHLTVVNETGTTITTVGRFASVGFTTGGVFLSDQITSVTLTIRVLSVDATKSVTNYIVGAPGQESGTVQDYVSSLSLSDVSIPVADWVYDSRYYTYKNNGGKNPWDVSVVQLNNYGLELDGRGNPVLNGNLTLNGQDRFSTREGIYFNAVQPWQHHTRTPAEGINVYSFSIHPEQHQPSGTCNMSRIDTAILQLKLFDKFRNANGVPKLDYIRDSKFYIFATNYNILRVMSGMAGVAYSN